MVCDGLDARASERHVDKSFAPRPAEGIAHYHAKLFAAQGYETRVQRFRRSVAVDGKENRHVLAGCVGQIDPGIRTDEAMMGLADQDAVGTTNNARRFAEDNFDMARIFFVLFRDRLRLLARNDVGESDQTTFRFRNDFLAQHEDAAA